jgi:crossover junction endodeoxyribonuclease RuvC
MDEASHTPVIIGIDPGYDRIGWAVGKPISEHGLTLQAMGCIQTNSKHSLIERYQQLDQELSLILKKYQPTQAAIETLYFSKNQKTALHVSEARGIIISTLFRTQVEIFEYNPVQIKQAVTGYGHADKAAIAKMITLRLGLHQSGKELDDTLDAVAIALTHALHWTHHDLIPQR